MLVWDSPIAVSNSPESISPTAVNGIPKAKTKHKVWPYGTNSDNCRRVGFSEIDGDEFNEMKLEFLSRIKEGLNLLKRIPLYQ